MKDRREDFCPFFRSRYIVFKMMRGSFFSVSTYNNFNSSLLTKGILHMSITGTVIFSFPNMAATSIFNWISSVGVGLGRNSCTGSGGRGTTFSVDGGGVSGYNGGVEALFFWCMSNIPSSLVPSSDCLSTYSKPGFFLVFLHVFWLRQFVPMWLFHFGNYISYPWSSYCRKNLQLIGDTHLLSEALGMENTTVFVLCQPFQPASKYHGWKIEVLGQIDFFPQ